jgi:hypothetical protein
MRGESEFRLLTIPMQNIPRSRVNKFPYKFISVADAAISYSGDQNMVVSS